MLKAVFYSDQVIAENAKIDTRVAEILKDRGRRIGYIASGPDPDLRFFQAKKAYYNQYGLDLAVFYDLDMQEGGTKLDALLACDAIHLSGGDTEAFLYRLRRSGMFDTLRDWANAGGILIGTSAGAMLMTPTIAVDAMFKDKAPQDSEDQRALDLVPFEFFPHAQKGNYLQSILAYSGSAVRPIVACSDGDGLVVLGDSIECIGDPIWLFRGMKVLVKPRTISEVRALISSGQH